MTALAHMLVFAVVRGAGGRISGWSSLWAVIAGVVFLGFLVREIPASRRERWPPDVRSSLAWGAACLMEFHLLSPFLSSSRIAAAVLFPAFAVLLPPATAAACGLAALGWLSWVPGRPWPVVSLAISQGLLAVPITAAAVAGRRWMTRVARRPGGHVRDEAVDRSLVVSWEGLVSSPEGENDAETEETAFRRSREEALNGIRRVLDGILPLTGADAAAFVARGEDPGRTLRAEYVAVRGEAPGQAFLAMPEAYVPVREAIVFRRPFLAVGTEAAPYRVRLGAGEIRPSGVATVPVELEGRVEGALLCLRSGEGGWTDPVVPILEMGGFFVAREIAAARRSFREALASSKQEAFNGLVRTIAYAAERGEEGAGEESVSTRGVIYGETVARMRDHIGADRVFLVEADANGSTGRIVALAEGPDPPVRRGNGGASSGSGTRGTPLAGDDDDGWIALADTYLEWVIGKQVHRIFTGLGNAPPRHPVLPAAWTVPGEDSCLLVPVSKASGFRGILVCASKRRAFLGTDAEAASEILRVMRMGLSHARQVENLSARATTDGLTGLLNQKTFRERLSRVMERLDGRHPGAVVMLDLDHFKRINDVFGHPAGDEVLRRTAAAILKTIRKADFAGRYGGEEFAVFLNQADRDHAAQAAERLRLVIRKTRFVFGGKEIGVTVSLGVACHPGDGKTAEELIGRADEALYRSKREGRDRVSMA